MEFNSFYIPMRELLWRRLKPVGKKAAAAVAGNFLGGGEG